MSDRISCCILGCRRSKENTIGFAEWICQRHWSAVPKAKRRAYASVKRRRKSRQAIKGRGFCRGIYGKLISRGG